MSLWGAVSQETTWAGESLYRKEFLWEQSFNGISHLVASGLFWNKMIENEAVFMK